MEREVYALNLKKQTTTRIAGSEGTNSAQFSEGCHYFVWQHSSVTTPPTYRICDSKGKTLRTMLKNLSRRNQVWFWVNGAWEALHPVLLLILSAMALAGDSYNPFLYFQF